MRSLVYAVQWRAFCLLSNFRSRRSLNPRAGNGQAARYLAASLFYADYSAASGDFNSLKVTRPAMASALGFQEGAMGKGLGRFERVVSTTLVHAVWAGLILGSSSTKVQAEDAPKDVGGYTIYGICHGLVDTVGAFAPDGTFLGCVSLGSLNGGNPQGPTQPNQGAGSSGTTTSGDKNAGTKTDCTSNPIIPATGNKIEPETDFATSGEAALRLARTYNHFWKGTGLFGKNWVSSLDFKLINGTGFLLGSCSTNCTIGATRTIEAWRPDGRTVIYNADAVGDHVHFHEDKPGSISRIVVQTDGTAILYGEDQSIETYASDGRVLSVRNKQGIGWTYTYANGLPTTVTHTSGRAIQLTWSGSSLTNVTDPAGNVYSFSYSGNKLISVTKPDAPATTITYHYELASDPYALTGKSFNGVRYSTFTYDPSGHAASSEHNGQSKYTFSYTDGSDGTLTVLETNPLGKKTTLVYKDGKPQSVTGQASTYCPATASSTQYDANGYLSQKTDFNGNVETFKYDVYGHLTERVEGYGKAEARKTAWAWDNANNRITSVTIGGVAAGSEMSRVDYTYTTDDRIASVATTDLSPLAQPSPANVRQITYAYTTYPSGMLQTVTVDGPLPGAGDAVTTSYDATGNLTSVKNSLGWGTAYSMFNGLGQPGRETNSNSANTDYTYDAVGRVVNVRTYVNGVAQDYGTTYNAFGDVSQTSSPDGQNRVYYYAATNHDWLQAIEEPMQPVLSGNSAWQGIQWDRNSAGESIAESTYVLHPKLGGTTCSPSPCMQSTPLDIQAVTTGMNEAGASSATTSSTYVQDFKTTSFSDYDELGRLIARRGNNGQNVTYGYDLNGNVVSQTDSLLHSTTYTYDALNRLATSKDPTLVLSSFSYDLSDRTVKVVDPKGNSTTYSYDGLGQLITATSPDTGITQYSYDQYGRLASMVRGDNKATTYGYDGLGRLTTITSNGQSQTFNYDACANGKGRLCSVTDPTGSVNYTYTPEGLLASQMSSMPASGAGSVSYSYDLMGRLAHIAYPDGVGVSYEYAYGKTSSVTLSIGGVTTTVLGSAKYLPFGPVTNWTYGNGLSRSYSYDLDGRVTGIGVSNSSAVFQSLTYGYNSNNQVTQITNGVNSGVTQSFSYDALSRLKSLSTGYGDTLSYTFDANGNRTKEDWLKNGVTTTTTYTVAPNSNRLTAMSGRFTRSYSYDANGNPSAITGLVPGLSYDAFNRLSSVTTSSGSASYAVNALGQRVYKYAPGAGQYWFIYGPAGNLVADYKAGGQNWTDYIWVGGQVVATVRNQNVFYVAGDQLGRPELITNSAGAAIWRANNYPFNRSFSLNQFGEFNVSLPGQYYDSETGNWYNGFRDYDDEAGRYLQPDPLGLGGGNSTYAYVGGDPVNQMDPSGMRPLTDCEKAALSGYFPDKLLNNIDVQQMNSWTRVDSEWVGGAFGIKDALEHSRTDGWTLGNTIYVKRDVVNGFDAGNSGDHSWGIGLLAHEVTHAWQYSLGGANFMARYIFQESTNGYEGNAFENIADKVASDVVQDLQAKGLPCDCR